MALPAALLIRDYIPALTEKTSATDWLLVVIGFVYTTVTAFQWHQMRRSVDIAERAWVLPSISAGPQFVLPGMTVKIRLRNTGRSPAFAAFAVRSSVVAEVPEVGENDYESGIVIPPASREKPILPHIIQLPDPTVADFPNVRNGTLRLFVWVFVKYRDGITDGRFTRLGWEYVHEWNRFAPCHHEYQVMK